MIYEREDTACKLYIAPGRDCGCKHEPGVGTGEEVVNPLASVFTVFVACHAVRLQPSKLVMVVDNHSLSTREMEVSLSSILRPSPK